MIAVPAILTLGVLGLLALSRETEPSAQDLDREVARYGQLIAENRLDEIDPAKLDALAKNLEKAGRALEMTQVNAWALYVRSVKRGVPAKLPPGLPASNSPTPTSPNTTPSALPAPVQARITMLLQQGEAASPFALEALAAEVEQIAPDNFAVQALRALAAQNRALMMPPPVQGVPRRAAYVAPRVGQYAYAPNAARSPEGLFVPPGVSRQMKCNHQGGCVLFRTPGSLYPSDVVVPFNARVVVLADQGAWFETVYGGRRGWLPKNEFVEFVAT